MPGKVDLLRALMDEKTPILEALSHTLDDGRTASEVIAKERPDLLRSAKSSLDALGKSPEKRSITLWDPIDFKKELASKKADFVHAGESFKVRWHDGGEDTFARPEDAYAAVKAKRIIPPAAAQRIDHDAEIMKALTEQTDEDIIAARRGEPVVRVPETVEELMKSVPSPGVEPPVHLPQGVFGLKTSFGGGGKEAALSGDPLGHPLGPTVYGHAGYVPEARLYKPMHYSAFDYEFRSGESEKEAGKVAFPMWTKIVGPYEEAKLSQTVWRRPVSKFIEKLSKGDNERDRTMIGLWLKAPTDVARDKYAALMRPGKLEKAKELEQFLIAKISELTNREANLTRFPSEFTLGGKLENVTRERLPAAKRQAFAFLHPDTVDSESLSALGDVSDGYHLSNGLMYLASRDRYMTPLYNELMGLVSEKVPGTNIHALPGDAVEIAKTYLNRSHHNPDWFDRALRLSALRMSSGLGPGFAHLGDVMSQTIYGGLLGFRVGPALRNVLTIPLMTASDVGRVQTSVALAKFFTPRGMREMLDRAREVGYLHGDYAPVYGTEGLESARETSTGLSRLYFNATRKAMGIFGATDDFTRIISFEAQRMKFLNAMDDFLTSRRTEGDFRKMTIKSGLIRENPVMKKWILGKLAEAENAGIDLASDEGRQVIETMARRYGNEKQKMLVGIYQASNKPEAFAAPGIGKMFGMLGNFPANSAAWFVNRLKYGRTIDRLGFLANYLANSYIVNEASKEYLGTDLTRYTYFGPFTFSGGFPIEVFRNINNAISGGPEADVAQARLKQMVPYFFTGGGALRDVLRTVGALEEGKEGDAARYFFSVPPVTTTPRRARARRAKRE